MTTIDTPAAPTADEPRVPGPQPAPVAGGPGGFLAPGAIPDERQLVVLRHFHAPRELVWRTLTELPHLTRWWGPAGFTLTTESFDLAVGGAWRFTMHGPDGTDYPNRIVYEELEEPSRIVYRHDDDGATCGFRTVLRLEDAGDAESGPATRLELRQFYASVEDLLDTEHRAGAIEGGLSTLGELADHLRRITDGTPDRGLSIALPSPTEILTQRELPAPRELVWEVLTRCEHMRHWYGCDTARLVECDIDLAVGGTYRWVVEVDAEGGAQRFAIQGEYREVVAPERLVYSEANESETESETGESKAGDAAPGTPAVTTVTLDEADGTTLLRYRVRHASAEARDAQLASGMENGAAESLDRLEAWLVAEARRAG